MPETIRPGAYDRSFLRNAFAREAHALSTNETAMSVNGCHVSPTSFGRPSFLLRSLSGRACRSAFAPLGAWFSKRQALTCSKVSQS